MAKKRVTGDGGGFRVDVETAIGEINAAGTVVGLAHTAMLDFVQTLAARKAVRLDREAHRLERRFGPDHVRTQRAQQRRTLHESFARAVTAEHERSAIPIPDAVPGAAVVYGRVRDVAPWKDRKLAVEAATDENERPIGDGKVAAADGCYRLQWPAKKLQPVVLRVRDLGNGAVVAKAPALLVGPGMRVYREILLPAVPPVDDDACEPAGGGESAPAITRVPDLRGMSLEDATAALDARRLELGRVIGPRTGRVDRQDPAADESVPERTAVGVRMVKKER